MTDCTRIVGKAAFLLQLFFIPLILLAEPKEINIAVLTELSGPFASNGDDCKIGHETAMQSYSEGGLVGKYKVNFIYGDSRGDGKTAISELNKIISSSPIYAILVNRSQVAMPINAVSKVKKIPILGVAGHSEFVSSNPYAFRLFQSAGLETDTMLKEIKKLNINSVSVISLQDEYMISLKNNFIEKFKAAGGKVLYDDSVIEGDTDFTSIASKISNAGADAVFVNLGLNQSGIMIKKLREQHVNSQIFSNFWVQKKEVIDSAGKENIEGTFYIGISNDLPKFGEALKKIRSDLLPSGLSYACHAAAGIVFDTLKNNNSINSKEDLYQALLQVKNFQLLDETINIKGRETEFNMVKFIIKNGAVVRAAN